MLNIFSCIKLFNSNTICELLMITKRWLWHGFLEFLCISASGFDVIFSIDFLRKMGEAEFWESRMSWPLKRWSSLRGGKYYYWESVFKRNSSSDDHLVRGRRELAVITKMLISPARKNSLWWTWQCILKCLFHPQSQTGEEITVCFRQENEVIESVVL